MKSLSEFVSIKNVCFVRILVNKLGHEALQYMAEFLFSLMFVLIVFGAAVVIATICCQSKDNSLSIVMSLYIHLIKHRV